jgi:hypothetical protein
VGRDVNNAQADTINGGVFFDVARAYALLVLSRVTEAEKAEVREQFVVPSGFGDAQRSLWERRVVLLCGRGCGRTYTARKLLVESGATTIAELNPDRRLDSVTADELEADGGYVWEADGSIARPLTDRDFTTIVKVMRDLGSRLVIVLGEAGQTPGAAVGCAVTLTAPPAAAVGRSQLRWRCPGDMDAEDAFTSPAGRLPGSGGFACQGRPSCGPGPADRREGGDPGGRGDAAAGGHPGCGAAVGS